MTTARAAVEPLEPRCLLATSPAAVLTPAIRQDLLDHLTLGIKASLQAKLAANNLAGFDQQLLDFMVARSSSGFFFDPLDVPDYASYMSGHLNTSNLISRANLYLSNTYQLQDGSEPTLTLPADIDWDFTGYSSNPETIHSLNRMYHWTDLAMAYRINGNASYATKIITQLADWASESPALADPETWHDFGAPWYPLNTGIRAEQWSWTYNLLLGTAPWSKEANTLFLFKVMDQAEFLFTVDPGTTSSNKATIEAQGLLYLSHIFPEFTQAGAWRTYARTLLFDSMDAQFYDDGSHVEQSPTYAGVVLGRLTEAKWIDQINGDAWPGARTTKLTAAYDAYYQMLSPDGNLPAVGDSYRTLGTNIFAKASLVLGDHDWPDARPTSRELWLFGPDTIDPLLSNPTTPPLGDRGSAYALSDSGYYMMRSGSDSDARQLIFDAGPKGGVHGQLDLFNFELFGYGAPLIADPGLYQYDNSAARAWATSTPAHNTVNLNGGSHGPLEGSHNAGIVVDDWDVQNDHVQITAHHNGYGYLNGRPVVSRSIWYDLDGTALVVDWIDSTATVTAKTSFLLPTTSTSRGLAQGWIRSTNSSGGNVKVQTLLQAGQTATYRTANIFTSSSPPPDNSDPATQFFVYQSGTFIAFATLITAYNGTTPPDITASLLNTPVRGQPFQIRLNDNGIEQDIEFTPPALTFPNSAGAVRATYTDVAYDGAGKVHVAFMDRDDNTLKYTVRDAAGVWSIVETIDNRNLTGFHPSIAVDANNNVGVAYNDGANGDLKFAWYRGGAWDVQTVDTRGTTGQFPSLIFTRKNTPVISYYDKSKGNLRLASATSSGWALVTLDAGSIGAADVGKHSHLVLDPSRPTASKYAIAYEDTSGKRYRYAIQGNIRGGEVKGAYTIFTIASAPSLGGYLSLTFDSQYRPAVSFYDAAMSGVRVATSPGSTISGTIGFTAKTVAEAGTVGLYSNLLYHAGLLNLLYYDASHNRAIRLVYNGTKWSGSNLAAGGRELHAVSRAGKLAYTNLDRGPGTSTTTIL